MHLFYETQMKLFALLHFIHFTICTLTSSIPYIKCKSNLHNCLSIMIKMIFLHRCFFIFFYCRRRRSHRLRRRRRCCYCY